MFWITQTHNQHHPDQAKMASGQGAITSSSDNQPKVVSHHETTSKRVRGYACPRCQLVLATQNERQTHTLTCRSGPIKGPISFSKAWIETAEESRRRNERVVTIDKVALPDSQTDTNTDTTTNTETNKTTNSTTNNTKSATPTSHSQPTRAEEDAGNRCNSCGRTFPTNRGLHQHTRSCNKRKESQNNRMNGGNRTKTTTVRQQIPLPCTQVGLCDRAVCPMQHVEPMPGRIVPEPETNQPRQQEEQASTANGRAETTATPATSGWGDLQPTQLAQTIDQIYNEIVFFKKNLFKLPSGAAGKEYIRETTRLLNMWIDNSHSVTLRSSWC